MGLRYSRSITVQFIRPLQRSAQRLGLPMEPLLREAGIGPQVLANTRSRVSPQQYARLVRAFWEASGEETLGMAPQRSKYGVFTLIAKQLIQCQTLGEVLRDASRYYNLVTDAFSLRFEEQIPEKGPNNQLLARFSIQLQDPSWDPDHMLIEFLLMIWHRFPSWMIGQRIPLQRVTLQHPEPPHADEYRLLFPCDYQCEQPLNSLVFERRWLDEPVTATLASLRIHLARAPLDWFIRQPFYPRVTKQVIDLLEQGSLEQLPRIETVALQLHMSVRSLRRKLEAEGHSFQQLKDDLRRDRAIQLLDQHTLSVAEVGVRLGFKEPGAFIRAFKHWTGLAPGAYRKQLK